MQRLTAVAVALSVILCASDVRAKSTTRFEGNGHSNGFAPHEQRGTTGTDIVVPDVETVQEVPLGEINNMDLGAGPRGEFVRSIPNVDRDLSHNLADTMIRDAIVQRETPTTVHRTEPAADAVIRSVQQIESKDSSVGRFTRDIGINANGVINDSGLRKAFDRDLKEGGLALNQAGLLPAETQVANFTLLHPLQQLRDPRSNPVEPQKRSAIEEDPMALKVGDVVKVLGVLKQNSMDNAAFNAEIDRRGISRDSAFLVPEGSRAVEELKLFKPGDLIQDGARGVARTFYSDAQGLQLGPLLIVSATQAAKPEALRRAIRDAVVSVTPRPPSRAELADTYALQPSAIGSVPEVMPPSFRRHDLHRPGAQTQRASSAVEKARLGFRQAAHAVSNWVQKLAVLIFPSQHAAPAHAG